MSIVRAVVQLVALWNCCCYYVASANVTVEVTCEAPAITGASTSQCDNTPAGATCTVSCDPGYKEQIYELTCETTGYGGVCVYSFVSYGFIICHALFAMAVQSESFLNLDISLSPTGWMHFHSNV